MNINYLIQILTNKISALNNAKSQATSLGDLNQVNQIDSDILETQNTLAQLNLLASINNQAMAANTTPTEIVASGVDAVQNPDPIIQGPSASAVINGYDISAYATDPLYEDKIRAIISRMPTFTLVGDIDTYIQGATAGSPVTGGMAYIAAQQYGVDLPLMMAIMQNDSGFGTLGIGATTFNPGNVGNTGSATQTFPSWQDGVNAVADWLNKHRVVVPTTVNQPAPIIDTTTTDTTSTDATSTPAVIPFTPAIVVPTTPVVATTTNATFLIPTINATTTPTVSTTTPDTATTTSTTTPSVDIGVGNTSTATSTSTTTPDVVTPIDTTATTTEATTLDATSTPDLTASSTQARRIVPKGKRRRV